MILQEIRRLTRYASQHEAEFAELVMGHTKQADTDQRQRKQKELAEKIKAVTAELDKQETKAMSADMFISTVQKYTRAKTLTERMLNELIERIEVF